MTCPIELFQNDSGSCCVYAASTKVKNIHPTYGAYLLRKDTESGKGAHDAKVFSKHIMS